ncbi:hypothetical protein BDW59DRAFT_165231 [Aspergillus cavernicola]|uniref:Uncharacterized protein n=1 Tax=Aspergillus cavernicola TaxID=176166 RepID=A0ABR4HUC2_9EURO
MASAQREELSRPETDYERWLREQDQHYKPEDQPVYGPVKQGLDDPIENGNAKQIVSHGSFVHPNYSMISNFILLVLLTVVVIKLANAFRKRRLRGSGSPLSREMWEK